MQMKSGSGAKKLSCCKYFNELSFLQQIETGRSTHSNLTIPQVTSPSINQNKQTSIHPPAQQHISSPPPAPPSFMSPPPSSVLTQPTATVQTKRKKKSSVEIDPVEEYLIKELAGSKKEPTPEQEKDAEDLFCLSIVPTLKRLPPKKRQLAKLKIQQLLFDLEFGDSDS